jgi:hypothetical protein
MRTTPDATSRLMKPVLVIVLACLVGDVAISAQRSRGNVRSSSQQSVNRNSGRNVNQNVNRNVNQNVNRNVNQNVNVNRNIDVNRDVDVNVNVNNRYGGYGCCYNSGWGTAAAVATAAVVTAAVVGSVVHTLPPSCTVVVVGGLSYQQCGSTWYQPQIAGGSTTYVVVNPPR